MAQATLTDERFRKKSIESYEGPGEHGPWNHPDLSGRSRR